MCESSALMAETSTLLKHYPRKHVINNVINEAEFWKVGPGEAVPESIGQQLPKRFILAGAVDQNDAYKGFDVFYRAMKVVYDQYQRAGVELVTFGAPYLGAGPLPGLHLGAITRDEVLRYLYNRAEVFVMPSQMEIFGKTTLESIACGTPVIAFNGTGAVDLIKTEAQGVLVDSEDGLVKALLRYLGKIERGSLPDTGGLGEEFRLEKVTQQYIDLYGQIVSRNSRGAALAP